MADNHNRAVKRLDQFLAECFDLSRSIAGREVKQGRVEVNGAVVKSPNEKVAVGDLIKFREIETKVYDKLYYMLNKPEGYVCANDDATYPIVFTLLSEEYGSASCHCVGRLDLDTTGLVLLTNDGQWSHRVASPKKHLGKTYEVTLDEPISDEAIEQLKNGVMLRGEKKPTSPADVEKLDDCRLLLTIYEGKYHQVKRMMAAVGNAVTALNRVSIGGLKLDPSLALGEYRALTEEEIAMF